MAKASFTTPDGVTVKSYGTPAEIAAVLKDMKGKGKTDSGGKRQARAQSGRVTIPSLVAELKQEDFLWKSKTLSDIRKRLLELGNSY